MKKKYPIKMLKDFEEAKEGKIYHCSKKDAETYVKNGYAEYIEEPKKKVVKKKDKSTWTKKQKEKAGKMFKEDTKQRKDGSLYMEGVKDIVEIGGKKKPKQSQFLIWVEKFKSYIVNIEEVANYLIKENNFKNVYGENKETLYLWNGKSFRTDGASFVKEECERLLDKYAKRNPIGEILEKVKRKTQIPEEEFFKTDKNFIPLLNGIWDIKNKKLIDHNPKYNFTFIIPIEKKEEVTEKSAFLNFIEETFFPADIPVVQEFYGFLLYREYFVKKGFICVGDTDTGKSVFIDTTIDFIGELNKCGITLQDISSGTKFTKNALRNKHLNVYDDLSSKDLNDGGGFKVATGGGYITGEKKFGDQVEFKSFAKQLFATNKIPPVKDNDDMAYFSRWIIFVFDNPPEKLDPFLRKKLVTSEEKSFILNWALKGLYRLLDKGNFSYSKSPEEVKMIMEISGDSLVYFGNQCLQECRGERISKDRMYEIYCKWANQNDKPIFSKSQLGRRLNQKVTFLLAKHDSKERYWDNVKLKENCIETIKL